MNKDLKKGSSVKSPISPADGKPMLPAVLKLTVKKEWFDLIKSGEKTEEYRELKEYWYSRLCQDVAYEDSEGNTNMKKYNYIEFKNGYAKDAPTIITKCKGISVGNPTQSGSQLFDKDVFIISIGDIVWSNCG